MKIDSKTDNCEGIDISMWQTDLLDKLKAEDNITFVICRATEGISFKDPMFIPNWDKLNSKHHIRGAYHFYIVKDDPIQQAKYFINQIGLLDQTDLPYIVKIEDSGINRDMRLNPKRMSEDLKLFLDHIERSTNRIALIYASSKVVNRYLGGPNFGRYPLWLSNHNELEVIPVMTNKECLISHASNTTARLHGIKVNKSMFKGDLFTLEDFIRNTVVS